VEQGASLAITVLSSSSSGNCSALVITQDNEPARQEVWLIDLGLSPRRTRTLLAQQGLGHVPIAGALLTHLDHDHMHQGWIGALPDAWRVLLHVRHEPRAAHMGLLTQRCEVFHDAFSLGDERVQVKPLLCSHDDWGSVAFRVAASTGDLGYATDIGRPTAALVSHLRDVDALAIESNYCPRMQTASLRPAFLKDRIMGGDGHLSNAQSAQLVRKIRPASDVILLHLSRQCNTPDVALEQHVDAGRPQMRVTVASPLDPTPIIHVRRSEQSVPATLWG
jgi:phosphoribosyl 1,2-cyclic phosphodiesterase